MLIERSKELSKIYFIVHIFKLLQELGKICLVHAGIKGQLFHHFHIWQGHIPLARGDHTVLGLPYGRRICEPELLAALASFKSPLAAAALREVIHRSNVSGDRMDEAALALKALHAMNTKEARGFLQEIANRRYALLRVYRRPLRTGAARMLRRRNAS